MPTFNHAIFSGNTIFQGAIFLGDASFSSAKYSAWSGFEEVIFSGDVRFDSATFSGPARFRGAVFLQSTTFSRTLFSGDGFFNSARFLGLAAFDNSIFAQHGRFISARFSGDARFIATSFSSDADFYGANFSEEVWFDRARFAAMRFSGATFERPVSFSRITWPEYAINWHGAFKHTVFREIVSFREAGFRSLAAFDGAIFDRGIELDEPSELAAEKTFTEELQAARGLAEHHDNNVESINDEHLRQLERGCRVLSQAMGKASNRSREQMLYRFELNARQAQNGIGKAEKWASCLYGKISDYGASFSKPLGNLSLLFVIFGVLYWPFAADFRLDPSAPFDWTALTEAVFVSAERTIPFVTFEGVVRDWMDISKADGWAAFPLILFWMLATLQTTLALALIFLFGLALRRRFQIS